jgi:radical SAM superfamily enzyme YgiQ (UPF0313 family)
MLGSKSIILSTVNARYSHTSFGLRYLQANLQDLESDSKILEFTLSKPIAQIIESILVYQPKVVGFGVYIWNVEILTKVVEELKRVAAEIFIVLGGPEVSHETEGQKIVECADLVICGEADFIFYDVCKQFLHFQIKPNKKILRGPLPSVENIFLPYRLYSDEDIKNRLIYVEASRGCPFRCEYCLSALDKQVRNFPIDSLLAEFELLIERGARQFKFVDRTFNLSLSFSLKILSFFLERIHLGLFLHFEMVPDRLPEELKSVIKLFPPDALQFEIGIQTWSEAVAKNVSRRQNYAKIRENFFFLKNETHVHTHADLIIGLPGETWESFAEGFNEMLRCEPDEVQVGILKLLKGAPIARHIPSHKMVFSKQAPFELLENIDLSREQMLLLGHFAKFWDHFGNSGNFKLTWSEVRNWIRDDQLGSVGTAFDLIMGLTRFLLARRTGFYAMKLEDFFAEVFIGLSHFFPNRQSELLTLLGSDFSRQRHLKKPAFLVENQLSSSLLE